MVTAPSLAICPEASATSCCAGTLAVRVNEPVGTPVIVYAPEVLDVVCRKPPTCELALCSVRETPLAREPSGLRTVPCTVPRPTNTRLVVITSPLLARLMPVLRARSRPEPSNDCRVYV